jgi:hypothetical protein
MPHDRICPAAPPTANDPDGDDSRAASPRCRTLSLVRSLEAGHCSGDEARLDVSAETPVADDRS